MEVGAGRNCTIFDSLRKFAYSMFNKTKIKDHQFQVFSATLAYEAEELNDKFDAPLSPSELRSIIKSGAEWVWRHFSSETFSMIQSRRGKKSAAKRWAGHTKTEPWTELGISRRTYYRKKKAGTL